MDKQLETMILITGGRGRYQIIILILTFFIWLELSINSTSLPMLEKVPMVTYNIDEKENITEPLTYKICEKEEYSISESFGFSWIIDMNIYCDKNKVGLIGSYTLAGLTIGSIFYYIIDKIISPKLIVIFSVFFYVLCLCSTTFFSSFYFRLFMLLFLGIFNALGLLSSMTLVIESASLKYRTLFTIIIYIGSNLSASLFIPLYVYLNNWKYVFWIQSLMALITLIFFIIIVDNSPRYYFSNNRFDEAKESLKNIAIFNGRGMAYLDKIDDTNFNKKEINEENKEKGEEKNIEEKKEPILGFSALFKYSSIRYKFFIFTFMRISTSFIMNSIIINTKIMEGNLYLVIVLLYFGEILSYASYRFIINLPMLGRKKSLILFFLGMGCGFGIYVVFNQLDFSPLIQFLSMFLIRFSLASVINTFYTYCFESYPASIRSLGYGVHKTAGHLAGIISPIIIEHIDFKMLYIIYAIICGVDCLLTFFLRETLGLPIRKTIDEYTDISNNKGVNSEKDSNLNKGVEEENKLDTNENENEKNSESLIKKEAN